LKLWTDPGTQGYSGKPRCSVEKRGISDRRENGLLEYAPTIEALTAALALDLKSKGISAELAEEIAGNLTKEFALAEVVTPPPGTLGALIRRYAIRRDDLKIFDALMDGLAAAASASFFGAHDPVLGANVGIGVSLAKFLRSLVMRIAPLDHDALQVLTILKCNAGSSREHGLTPDEILEVVQRTKPDADLPWLQQRLNLLMEAPTRYGDTTELASRDQSGRWRSHV